MEKAKTTDDVGTYVAFRYDFSETEQDRHYLSVIGATVGHHTGIAGVENHNKYGEEIKKHLHYHFIYPANKKDTETFVGRIRKQIQRDNSAQDNPRGKGYYSLTMPSVEDPERWFRYPMKQCETFDEVLTNSRTPVPQGFDLRVQWKMAQEEYVRDKEYLSRRREVADKRQTTYQKILASIEESKVVFTDLRSVYNYVIQYYRDEVLPLERHKIRSFVDSIGMKYRLISEEEYYRQVMA